MAQISELGLKKMFKFVVLKHSPMYLVKAKPPLPSSYMVKTLPIKSCNYGICQSAGLHGQKKHRPVKTYSTKIHQKLPCHVISSIKPSIFGGSEIFT